eukprot:gene4490-biopygen22201
MQLLLRARPMLQSRIPLLSLCQPTPQWSTTAASHVIRAPLNERPLWSGWGETRKEAPTWSHGYATNYYAGWKAGQASPVKGPAGPSQRGREREASSGNNTSRRKSHQDDKATVHPAKLMGRIMACADLSSLDQVVTDHGQRFNDRHVSIAMNRAGKLYERMGRNEVARAQRMMQALSVFALHELNIMGAQSLSNVLGALAKVGGPVNPALVATWLRVAKPKLLDFNAQDLSNSLWAAEKLGIQDKDFTDTWLRVAKPKLPDFNAQNLSNSLLAAAKLGIKDKAFTDTWLRVAKPKLPDFNSQELSNSLWAAAKLGIKDKAFTDTWLRVAKPKLPDFNAQGLSNSLWAAAELGIEDKAFSATWLRVAKPKLPDFNVQNLFISLWAAANLGIKDDDFAATWLRVAKLKLPVFDVQALSNNMSSAADRGTDAPTVQVVGDASDKALAAYTPNGELRQAINQPFSEEELKAVRADKWSSTARELAVVKLALQVMEEQRPGYLAGKTIQYGTDCEVAVMMMHMIVFPDDPTASPFAHDVTNSTKGTYADAMATAMSIKGGASIVPLVKDIRLLCEELGVELDVVWRRRNHPEQQVADDLSKVEDQEDWSLHQGVYLKVLEHPCLQGRRPTLDVFASAANTKVQSSYYSKYLGVGCLGVDAFKHPWVREGTPREEQLAYIHGPFHLLPQILQRVSEQQVDCIVITPGWNGPWASLLSGLPVQATMELQWKADLLVAGALVPARDRGDWSKRPKDPLKASIILWGSKQAAYTPNGELRQAINQPFSREELKAVQADKWSSTARELAVVKLALQVMEKERPGYLAGKRFQYGTDCEVAVMMMHMILLPDAPTDFPFAHDLTSSSRKYDHDLATAMGIKGGESTVPLMKQIRLLCEELGVELDVVWRRRKHPEQQVADHLSKVEDQEDWSLHQGVYVEVIEHPCLQGRRPTLDVFASGANTKVQGAYYFNYLGVGCLGVDAFQHPWVREGTSREEQLAYIHGPFHLLPQILQKGSEQQVDCIV